MSASHFQLTMKNGREFEIRPCIEPGTDFTAGRLKQEIKQALPKLSAQTLWKRFASSNPNVSDKHLDYLTDIDGVNHVAWCAAVTEQGQLKGVGLARYIRVSKKDNFAEFALTVIDEYQHEGIGCALLRQLVLSAYENHIQILRGNIVPSNIEMLRLVEDFNPVLQQQDGFIRADIVIKDYVEKKCSRNKHSRIGVFVIDSSD